MLDNLIGKLRARDNLVKYELKLMEKDSKGSRTRVYCIFIAAFPDS